MKKFYKTVLVLIALLTLTAVAAAQGPVGADCTDPPNVVPGADLTNCDLSGEEMEGVDLSNANLTGANLEEANLFTSILRGATFDNANLRSALMEDADARDATFIGADMRGVDLYFSRLHNANFSNANFSNTYLHSVDFPATTLQNTNFSGATMSHLTMRDADLRGANFTAANLVYVVLEGTDFRDATLLSVDRVGNNNLEGITWGNTTCPDGSNSDDNDGDGFTCAANFPDNVPPAVTLTSPAPGATFARGETIHISADATDNDSAIIRLEFYANDTQLGLDGTVPYSFDWTDADAGSYAITAKAFDDDGGVSTSEPVTIEVEPSPNNQPPTISITSPRNNATVYRFWGTSINATANDPDGVVTKVEFYVGNTLLNTDAFAPYSFYWRPASRGNQTLTAKAYDDDGAVTTSAPISVRVK